MTKQQAAFIWSKVMILVTGGAGYIGSHFIRHYLTQNPSETVVAVDNLSEGHPEALDFSSQVKLVKTPIGDKDQMVSLFKQYDIQSVIHFAASCYVGESQENPAKYFENNVQETLRLFDAMETCGIKQIVFSSTCATYGNPKYVPIDEAHPQQPINVYGSTKLITEQTLRAYALAKGWSYVALRYFNAAGADDSGQIGESHYPETHLIPLILQVAAGKRKSIHIYGNDYDTPDGTCIRDYIHINDLASAHSLAIEYLKKHPGGEAFNLGTTQGASVLEVIDHCKTVTGKEIPTEVVPRRPGDPPILVANADKAETQLGWKPKYTLPRIIETAWHWEQHRRY
nr:galE: UDP-glucose [uncultured bacterium]ALS92444.1 galE: UDP-glucose [uncultured bacterium]